MNNILNTEELNKRHDLFKGLCTGRLKLDNLWEKRSYRYKFALRSIFLYPNTLRWLKKLVNYPLLGHYLTRQTNLPCKLQRPYLSSSMSNKESLNALIYHYDFLAIHNPKLTYALYSEHPFLLAELSGKNDKTFKLYIQSINKYAREGELSIYLVDESDNDLATLTFSFIEYKGKSTLFIAGLQGSNSQSAKGLIQQATKACYGLFPKRLVVEATLAVADFFRIEQVVAVSNEKHIYNNWRYTKRMKHVHSDYNNFWLSLNGVMDQRGLFTLPQQIARKPLSEVPSKKRFTYRCRYELLDSLMKSIKLQLEKLQ